MANDTFKECTFWLKKNETLSNEDEKEEGHQFYPKHF